MSRVGKTPIKVLQGVKVEISNSLVKVEGPKGKLTHKIPMGVSAKVINGEIIVERDEGKTPKAAALHGLTRTLLHNMIHGAHTGFTKDLEVVGVGYRAAVKGQTLSLTVGFSHPIDYVLPTGITAKVDANTKIQVSGSDKMLVGLVSAKIRGFKPPEPYQGKGIKYANETIIRKQGKAAGAK